MEEEVQSEEAASNLRELNLPESSTSETSGQNEAHTDGLVAEVYFFVPEGQSIIIYKLSLE